METFPQLKPLLSSQSLQLARELSQLSHSEHFSVMIGFLTLQPFLSQNAAEALLVVRIHAIVIVLKIHSSDLEQLALFPFSISP